MMVRQKYVLSETNCYQNETIDFNTDGTGTVNCHSYADITLDLVAGSTTEYEYAVDCIQETDATSITWVQNGNTLLVTSAGFSLSGTLSGNTFTAVIPSGFVVEVEDGSGTAFTTEDITFVYTKQ